MRGRVAAGGSLVSGGAAGDSSSSRAATSPAVTTHRQVGVSQVAGERCQPPGRLRHLRPADQHRGGTHGAACCRCAVRAAAALALLLALAHKSVASRGAAEERRLLGRESPAHRLQAAPAQRRGHARHAVRKPAELLCRGNISLQPLQQRRCRLQARHRWQRVGSSQVRVQGWRGLPGQLSHQRQQSLAWAICCCSCLCRRW